MPIIHHVQGRTILDSRGNPTVEVEITTVDDHIARAAVPSGASTGEHEALELRDGDANRWLGKGVDRAVSHVNGPIAECLIGLDTRGQAEIDATLLAADGSDNKGKLGANAILGASLAAAKAGAMASGLPLYRHVGGTGAALLPVPMMNILNGGAHADNNVDIQEFMVMPHGLPTFTEALRAGVEITHTLRGLLHDAGLSTAVGDEGGFAPNLAANADAMTFICKAIEQAGYTPGDDVSIALDVAASELVKDGRYHLGGEGLHDLSADDLIAWYTELAGQFPLVSIEDGLAEDDWDGWAKMTAALGDRLQVVGDDLYCTDPKRLQRGIDSQASNAILIKVNQIGTLTETTTAVQLAQHHAMASVMSHRSGETEDATIADLAVGLRTGQIKTGAPVRSDRTAKYNQLLRIEGQLGAHAHYAGSTVLPR